MEFGNDKCLQLIEEYKSRPVLWDPNHELYYSKIKKLEAWQEIGDSLGIELQAAKQKMCSLLGSFRRERTKGKRIVGVGENRRKVYVSRWYAFNKFHFLLDREDDRRFTNNVQKILYQPKTLRVKKSQVPCSKKTPTDMCNLRIKRKRRSDIDDDEGNDECDEDDMMVTLDVNPDMEEQPDLATMAAECYYNDYQQQVDEDGVRSAVINSEKSGKVVGSAVTEITHPRIVDSFSYSQSVPASTETEFDLWARSMAVQLNGMDTLRALRLQFKLQKLISDERIEFEIEKIKAAETQSKATSGVFSETNSVIPKD